MIFPANIIGPSFDQGDLVTFIFEGAELTFRAPTLPENKHKVDELSSIRDFRNIDASDWNTDDQEHAIIQLLLQHWSFEDSRTLDNIARCRLYVELVEVSKQDQLEGKLFSASRFQELMLSWHSFTFKDDERKNDEGPSWPSIENRFNGRPIAKKNLNWFLVELPLNPRLAPIQLVMIPINNRFVLMAYIKIESLHYAGRTNPFSNELLKQFERDLFEDFLSHINIEYSPELISTIQSLKNKEPA